MSAHQNLCAMKSSVAPTLSPEISAMHIVGPKVPASLNLVAVDGGIDKARSEHQRLMCVAIHWPVHQTHLIIRMFRTAMTS